MVRSIAVVVITRINLIIKLPELPQVRKWIGTDS